MIAHLQFLGFLGISLARVDLPVPQEIGVRMSLRHPSSFQVGNKFGEKFASGNVGWFS